MRSSVYNDDDIDCDVNFTTSYLSQDHNYYYYNTENSINITLNITSSSTTTAASSLAPLHILVPGTVVFFLTLPLVLFHFRWFPIGPSASVLLGALLMIVTQVVSQQEAYDVIGNRHNLTAVFLLLGMMLIAQYVEREQLLVLVLRRFLHHNQSFANYIWRICMLSFLLSAFFTNDACCAIFTPLAVKFWESQERPRGELETLLIAIATSANIGSVSTVFGNPQMALIAAKTSTKAYTNSRLDMLSCVIYLLPAAIIVAIINTLFLVLHHKLRTRRSERATLISEPSQSEQEMAGLAASKGCHIGSNGLNNPAATITNLSFEGLSSYSQDRLAFPSSLETIKEDEVLEIPETRSLDVEAQERELVLDSSSEDSDENIDSCKSTAEDLTQMSTIAYKPSMLNATNSSSGNMIKSSDLEEQHDLQQQGILPSLNRNLDEHGLQLWHRGGIYKSVSAVSASEFLPPDTGLSQLNAVSGDNLGGIGSQLSLFTAGDSTAFPVILLILLTAVIVLFLASTKAASFDIGLVPMGAATLALVADAALNRRSGLLTIKRVDWSIILLFFGLFIWIHGFNNTRIPSWLWHHLGLDHSMYISALEVVILTAFVLVGSNIFSNVPLTLILLDQLKPCLPQKSLALYLAWVTTIAGNLTLFGSVANLIVVQKGMQAVKFRLTFWQYFVFGFPTTLLHTVIGLCIIAGLLLIPL